MEDDKTEPRVKVVLEPQWSFNPYRFKVVVVDEPEDEPSDYEFNYSSFGTLSLDTLDLATDDLPPPPAGDGIMTLGLEEPVY